MLDDVKFPSWCGTNYQKHFYLAYKQKDPNAFLFSPFGEEDEDWTFINCRNGSGLGQTAILKKDRLYSQLVRLIAAYDKSVNHLDWYYENYFKPISLKCQEKGGLLVHCENPNLFRHYDFSDRGVSSNTRTLDELIKKFGGDFPMYADFTRPDFDSEEYKQTLEYLYPTRYDIHLRNISICRSIRRVIIVLVSDYIEEVKGTRPDPNRKLVDYITAPLLRIEVNHDWFLFELVLENPHYEHYKLIASSLSPIEPIEIK